MIPELNEFGQDGWELVRMEPVGGVGKNGDVSFTRGYGTLTAWSNAYFCVFKRRREGRCWSPVSFFQHYRAPEDTSGDTERVAD